MFWDEVALLFELGAMSRHVWQQINMSDLRIKGTLKLGFNSILWFQDFFKVGTLFLIFFENILTEKTLKSILINLELQNL